MDHHSSRNFRYGAILLGMGLLAATFAHAAPPEAIKPAPPADLKQELTRRYDEDQRARLAMLEWLKRNGVDFAAKPEQLSPELKAELETLSAATIKADRENTQWLREIVERHGWPTRTQVGARAASAAWLLVQHADAEPKFQRQCLDLMAALPAGEVEPKNVAYLTDRVLLAEGKPQRYGTQFDFVAGKLQPKPIEDEDHVDQRRAEVGLQPLAEYAKSMAATYDTKAQ
jgi:hypothetical protein